MLATAAEAIRIITALVYPVLPASADIVWRQLGQGEIAGAAKDNFLSGIIWGGLKPGTKFGEPAPLFPRAEKDAVTRMEQLEAENNKSAVEAVGGPIEMDEVKTAPAEVQKKVAEAAPAAEVKSAAPVPTAPAVPASATATASAPAATTPAAVPAGQPAAEEKTFITIDDFSKVELRVAQIIVAERIPKADKLLRLEVDLGDEKRQILAGIAQYYEPEKLIGRKIIIVANLAPRTMRGLVSHGMLLAASLEGGVPVLAGFHEEVPLGARLK